jgi:hypothetical protein
MMKKMNLFMSTLILTSVLASTGIPAYAEEAEETPKVNSSTANTNGLLTVEKPDAEDPEVINPVAPVNPNDPDTPFVPSEEGGKAGTSGLITIDFAPNLDFGTLTLGVAQKKYAALQSGTDSAGTPTSVQNYVQVSDKTGNYAGWELSVKRSEFKHATETTKTLAGTKLTFKNAVVRTGTEIGDGLPSVVNGTGAAGIELPIDTKTTLVKANANEGLGTWIYALGSTPEEGETSVELDIPVAKYAEGSYTSTLEWTITDAPGA